MIKIIKELHGFSNNRIFLVSKNGNLIVKKRGNVLRNVERMLVLSSNFPLPKIYSYSDNHLDMEYIHGLDIKTYLKTRSYDNLLEFIVDVLEKFKSTAVLKNYTDDYNKKLSQIDFSELVFTKEQLLEKLPKELPSSEYHGDLTLENILYNINSNKFVLIDPVTTEYNSYIFDIAKMRQDLQIGWFVRNTPEGMGIDVKLKHIQQHLLTIFPEADNDYLLILMLLRVYNYAKIDSFEKTFLKQGINSLWK
jgi:Phosphotransferase enzyme family